MSKPLWRQQKTLGRGSKTPQRYWLRIDAAPLKKGALTRGNTSHTPMTRTEKVSRSKRTNSSISEPATSGRRRVRSFVPISKITTCGDKEETIPRSRRNLATVRPPTPCKWTMASLERPNVSSARESKCERRSSRSLRIKEWPNTRTEGTEEAMEMNKRLEQSEKKGWYPRSENNTAMNCNKRSAQRPKLTGNNKRKARSEKQNTTTKIGEQNDDEIAVRIKTYQNLPRSKSKEASNSEQ